MSCADLGLLKGAKCASVSRRHYQESILSSKRDQEITIESPDSQAQKDLHIIVQEQLPFEING